jgi:Tol biopolymer transport system component
VPKGVDSLAAVAWAGNRLVFTSAVGGQRVISSVGPDGGVSREVVTQGSSPAATSDGRTIVFRSSDPARPGLWKITDGGRPEQLTAVDGNWLRVTRDDRHVVFTSQSSGIQSLWMVSIDGGTPTQITNRFAARPTLSPDGKAVAFASTGPQNRDVLLVCDLPACPSPRSLSFPEGTRAMQKWTPDGQGITYVTGTPPNLWVHPLDGKAPRQLTHFTDDRTIADIAWSHDGQRLAIARTTTTNDIVLFKGLKR